MEEEEAADAAPVAEAAVPAEETTSEDVMAGAAEVSTRPDEGPTNHCHYR